MLSELCCVATSRPGRAALNQPITSFNLNPNDRFAYQTAMLYDYQQQLHSFSLPARE